MPTRGAPRLGLFFYVLSFRSAERRVFLVGQPTRETDAGKKAMHTLTTREKTNCSYSCCETYHMCWWSLRHPLRSSAKNQNKTAFEAQRMEIAALHTAGERAVVRTSQIRRELDTSERELTALEREMHEIGQCVAACCQGLIYFSIAHSSPSSTFVCFAFCVLRYNKNKLPRFR